MLCLFMLDTLIKMNKTVNINYSLFINSNVFILKHSNVTKAAYGRWLGKGGEVSNVFWWQIY